MPKIQKFNKRTDAWVIFHKTKKGLWTILNVKQQKPTVPFKGIKIVRNKSK